MHPPARDVVRPAQVPWTVMAVYQIQNEAFPRARPPFAYTLPPTLLLDCSWTAPGLLPGLLHTLHALNLLPSPPSFAYCPHLSRCSP
jgi:hypothetical protein